MEGVVEEEKSSILKKKEKRVRKEDLDDLAEYLEDTNIQVVPQQMGNSVTVLS